MELYYTFVKKQTPQYVQLNVWLRVRQLDHRVPRAPLPDMGVNHTGMISQIIWKGITPSSSLILAHAPDQPPPRAFDYHVVHVVFAGCHQSLLGIGPSRHYLYNPCAGARIHTPP